MSNTHQLFKSLLLLLSLSIATTTSELSSYSYQVRKEGSRHSIYPDLFRNNTFFLLEVFSFDRPTNGPCGRLQVDWLLSIYRDGQEYRQFSSWVLSPGDVLLVGDTQQRLDADKLTFTGYSRVNGSHGVYSFYEYDVDGNVTTVAEEVDTFGNEISVDGLSNRIDAKDACLFGFEGKRKRFVEPDTFDAEIEVNKLFGNSDSIVDEFTIVGDGTNRVSKAVLYHSNPKLNWELRSFENITGIDMFMSCQSICWMRTKPDKLVHCSQFYSSGEILFNRTVTFSRLVEIVSVRDLRPGRVLLVTKTSDAVYITDVRNEAEAVPRDSSEDFSGCDLSDDRHLTFDAREIEGEIVVEYVCRNGSLYTFKHFVVKSDQGNVRNGTAEDDAVIYNTVDAV